MENSQKIIHIIVWGLIIFGTALSFYLFPGGFVLPPSNFMALMIIPAIVFWIYGVFGHRQIRRDLSHGTFKIEEVASGHEYGMLAHPICVSYAILAWGIFFLYPDFRILVSVLWLTVVISLWLRVEKNAFLKPDGEKLKNEDNIAP